MHGPIRTRQIQTKVRRRAMNGMVFQTKMGKMNQTRGRVVVQINDTNIVRELEITVHPLQNHRKSLEFMRIFILYFYRKALF